MKPRKTVIATDPERNLANIEVFTEYGVVPDTVFIAFNQTSVMLSAWFTKETLDDLITVLQFARLERFGNDAT